MSMSSLLAFCVDRFHYSIAKSLPASVCPAWHILNVTHQEHHRDAASICIGASAQVPTYLYKNVPAVDYSAPDMGAEYCNEHVCVCLSVRECFPRNYASNLHKMFVHVTEEGRILVFL